MTINQGLLQSAAPQRSVRWVRPTSTSWYELNTVDLGTNPFDEMRGVYLIWCEVKPLPLVVVIYVGQGNIRERLSDHRQNPEIQAWGQSDTLFVTWAEVGNDDLLGVEAFLAKTYRPRVGQHNDSVRHIPVNLPFNPPPPIR